MDEEVRQLYLSIKPFPTNYKVDTSTSKKQVFTLNWNQFYKMDFKFIQVLKKDFNFIPNNREDVFDQLYRFYNLSNQKVNTWSKGDVKSRLTSTVHKINSMGYDFLCNVEKQLELVENNNQLDVGSGDGIMGYVSSILFKRNVVFSDIKNNLVTEVSNHPFVTIKDGIFNLENKTFSIVTLFHIIHHIETEQELKTLLKELYDSMETGGILIIRDHDVINQYLYFKICLIHILYELQEMSKNSTKTEITNWLKHYSLNLMSFGYLRYIFESIGFKLDVLDGKDMVTLPTAKDGSYYAIFKKF